mmetsp:Transcript_6948/g.13883  ORF Transcript_6948/g.13883 Transcript_6948/m.13883 type:complete len:667 (+) Transcript_6948:143-2143(+)
MQRQAVLGFVRRVSPHPDADKLRLCEVDIGGKSLVQIICGAKNVREGLHVAVAPVGAQLELANLDSSKAEPLGTSKLKIKKAKMRGQSSNGMICSLKELGFVSESHDLHAGIWEIQDTIVAEANAKPGQQIGDDWPQKSMQDVKALSEVRKPLEDLKAHWETSSALSEVSALLEWDQSTMMPPPGAPARGKQKSVLSKVIHEMNTSETYKSLLKNASDPAVQKCCNAFENRSVTLAQRDLILDGAIAPDLVAHRTKLQSECLTRWAKAREMGKWAIVEPIFSELLDVSRQVAKDQADALASFDKVNAPEGPYGALVQQFVLDVDERDIANLFSTLRDRLVPLVKKNSPVPQAEYVLDAGTGPLFEISKQKEFSEAVLKSVFGKELGNTRLDESVHPFSIGISDGDVRITTRYNPKNMREGLMGSLHEAGHALYELGAPARGWPAGTFLDIATHESQSLFLERMVGQSRAFSKWIQPRFQQTFGYGRLNEEQRTQLDSHLYSALNAQSETFVRVDSDELRYPLHIIARFELERELINGTLNPKQLPEAWIQLHQELLGQAPPANDGKKNVLQDMHWFAGYFGYFPSYTIGAIAAHQLFVAMETEIGAEEVKSCIETGKFEPIINWLRTNVHSHGRMDMGIQSLLQRVTGQPLNAEAYCDYLEKKYSS